MAGIRAARTIRLYHFTIVTVISLHILLSEPLLPAVPVTLLRLHPFPARRGGKCQVAS